MKYTYCNIQHLCLHFPPVGLTISSHIQVSGENGDIHLWRLLEVVFEAEAKRKYATE